MITSIDASFCKVATVRDGRLKVRFRGVLITGQTTEKLSLADMGALRDLQIASALNTPIVGERSCQTLPPFGVHWRISISGLSFIAL